MHGGIGPAVEDRLLDLLDEHALAADRVQRHGLISITGRLHEHELDRFSGLGGDRVGDDLGLGAGLRTSPSGQPERCARHSSGWAEVEEVADGGGVALTLGRAGVVTQAHRRLMQQLGDDRLGQRFDRRLDGRRRALRGARRSAASRPGGSARRDRGDSATSGAACRAVVSRRNSSSWSAMISRTRAASAARAARPRCAHALTSSRSSTVTPSTAATAGSTLRGREMSITSSG